MDSNARRQIDLLARHEVKTAIAQLAERRDAIYSEHGAHGRLHSGLTVRRVIAAMEELACSSLDRLSSKVKAISTAQDAFEAVQLALEDLVDFFREEIPALSRMASGRGASAPDPSIQEAANDLFVQLESELETRLQILEYDFGKVESQHSTRVTSQIRHVGGRPPASYWDDMWATIAVQLYCGDLQPKTQASIEKAMAQWIENSGHSVAISTVRSLSLIHI